MPGSTRIPHTAETPSGDDRLQEPSADSPWSAEPGAGPSGRNADSRGTRQNRRWWPPNEPPNPRNPMKRPLVLLLLLAWSDTAMPKLTGLTTRSPPGSPAGPAASRRSPTRSPSAAERPSSSWTLHYGNRNWTGCNWYLTTRPGPGHVLRLGHRQRGRYGHLLPDRRHRRQLHPLGNIQHGHRGGRRQLLHAERSQHGRADRCRQRQRGIEPERQPDPDDDRRGLRRR